LYIDWKFLGKDRTVASIKNENPEFELRGFNHLALVCTDMEETVDFYTNVLGMNLVKTLSYPNGGQHFFLDMGNGIDGIAFFWFPEAPAGVPGVSLHVGYDENMERTGQSMTAQGTMHHVAFDVAPEKMDDYLVKLRAKGIKVTDITNHADSLHGGHKENYDPDENADGDIFVRSLYFKDPSGIVLEFAAWTTTFDESDIEHKGKTAADLRPVETVAGA
jgi:catechol 2,3-dioxygenase-like lactoylglutathione lyase family enzyme